MTAAAGVLTGLAKLKRQDSARSQNRPIPASPGLGAPAPEAAPRKRKRRTDVVVVRGRLRLYSASGFFLLLGLVILAIGIGMATLGYWPQSEATPPAKSRTGGEPDRSNGTAADATAANASAFNNVQATPSKQTGGALARFLEQHRHSERMKMFGPFTMGIGIFIFICANAILHENRDRETKIIHMRDMYSTVIDIHRLRQREHKLQQHHQHHQQRHRSSTFSRDGAPGDLRAFGLESAARLAGNSLLSFSRAASVGGGGAEDEVEEEEVVLLGGGDGREEEEELCRQREQARLDCSLAGLLAPLYKDRPFYGQPGRSHHHHLHLHHQQHHHHHHQWSVDSDGGGVGGGGGGGHHARSIVSSSISAFTLPVIKLNNCVIDEPEMEAITEEERSGGGGDKGDPEQRGGPPAGLMESLAVPPPSLAKASKPPGLHRSNSASSCSSSCCSPASPSLSPSPSPTSACWLSPGAARTDLGSNSSLHVLGGHSKSLDLERGPGTLSVRPEQRKHPSWPRLDRSNSSGGGGGGGGSGKGYVRLQDREDHGEGRLLDVPACAASRRDYSKREKLLMISRSHNNLTFEHDEFNSSALKRGSSETRF